MPRSSRIASRTDIYHVMLRGMNKQCIFQEDYDFHQFLLTLQKIKENYPFDLFGYCLMSNHIHLLLRPKKHDGLQHIIQSLGARFVSWYNSKYERCGYLFQGRFHSEPVETSEYFLTVLRYIHNNPIKAGTVRFPNDYHWSSSRFYFGDKQKKIPDLVDTSMAFAICGSWKNLQQFLVAENKDECLDIPDQWTHYSDQAVIQMLRELSGCQNMYQFPQLRSVERDKYIVQMHKRGISIRQLARTCYLSKATIERILQQDKGT